MSDPSRDREEYYPGKGAAWAQCTPEEVGLDGEKLQEAIDFSLMPDLRGFPRDLNRVLHDRNAAMPNDDGVLLGPAKDHGPVTGIVIRHGYIVSEWGEPDRVDMTFSVTKSFLSTTAGLAWDKGLINEVDDPIADTIDDGGFDSPHNSRITWSQMLRQTSEWHGTLWDKPSTAGNTDGVVLDPVEPGSRYEYNDVRVNRLALCLLRLWRKPLPEVLRDFVMGPIDASDTWEWHGYDNSWINMDGQSVQSVSGGGHWGGGMWISARDLARIGYLTLRGGRWSGRQIIPEAWIRMSRTPGPLTDTYGFMNYFLNTNLSLVPSAPESSFYHGGMGVNRVWCDPDHDLVVVIRWIDGQHFDEFVRRILAALT